MTSKLKFNVCSPNLIATFAFRTPRRRTGPANQTSTTGHEQTSLVATGRGGSTGWDHRAGARGGTTGWDRTQLDHARNVEGWRASLARVLSTLYSRLACLGLVKLLIDARELV